MAHHYLEYFAVDFDALCDYDQLLDAIMVGEFPDNPRWLEDYKEKGYEEDAMEIYNEYMRMCKEAYKKGCTDYADDYNTEGPGLYGWDYEDRLSVCYEGELSELSRKELEK